MADLLDIAPATACAVVKIDGRRIIVRGLNANALGSIAVRFPEVVGVLLGGGIAGTSLPELMAKFGSAVAPIIAAGCGHLADEQYERIADNMVAEYQLDLVTAIIGLTFPNGLISFVKRMMAQVAAEGEKPVKVRLRKSPSPSPPLSAADSRPSMQ